MSLPSDEEIRRAQLLGRASARANRRIDTCPYGEDQRVLRHRWVRAYIDGGGRAGLESKGEKVRRALARMWRGRP